MSLDIDPRLNGIHSLAEALRAFQKFHLDQTNVFALKDSVLRTHHAMETLFKHILYQRNEVFLVPSNDRINKILDEYEKVSKGENVTIFDDDLRTIGLIESIERLKKFNYIPDLPDFEFYTFLDAIKTLTKYRNALQHFGISANLDVISRILGNVIPRSIDVIESIPMLDVQSQFVPSHILSSHENILQELEKIFPESQDVIDLLRYNYDKLIREVVEYFTDKSFDNQILSLKITDHGKVGAGPYMPQIKAEGFITLDADPIQMRFSRRILPPPPNLTGVPFDYEATINIREPIFVANPRTPDYGIAEGSFVLDGRIKFMRAEETLSLDSADEKIAILRELYITIHINLNYKSEALYSHAHYHCDKIIEANGNLNIVLTTIPRGYEREEMEIIGRYEIELDETNSPFRLHAFRNPDGSLRENRSLEWNINSVGNLRFD